MEKVENIIDSAKLRRLAEEALEEAPDDRGDLSEFSPEEMTGLIHELRVHQIELKMQNEELRRIQRELEKARDRYSHLYDFAPVGYFTVSEKGIVVEANLTAAALLGMERSGLVGSPFSRVVLREDQDILYFHRKRLLETKNPQSCRLRLVKKDSREFYANLEWMMVEDGDGGLRQIRIVASDITEQKELENKLQQARKMEAIGTIAGGIAHRFNNALHIITSRIDLLEMDFPGDENVSKSAKEMRDSAFRMAQLTAQLLAYARGGKYHAKTVSLSDFVRETLPWVRHFVDSSIDVISDLPLDMLNVKVDLLQMQMVLSAVLINASEAIEGEGRIRIACRNEIITEEIDGNFPKLTPGNYACLMIADDGKGMNEETNKRVFEPFFTTKAEGRGLGLAAAYGIVKNHDGWISVDSELGKGTVVKIYLPAVEATVKEDAKSKPKAEPIKGQGTIMVIEDEELVMKVTREILKRLGYRVLEAKTGQEAIDVVQTFDGDIDLAMLDILLPGMSGDIIYPLLMKARPNLKVIVFSGYSIDGPAQKILNAGAEDFIQKPFTIVDLSEKLKKILGGDQLSGKQTAPNK
jgi:two-component system cell cycle sensor histidine kinase/response regulator CckA